MALLTVMEMTDLFVRGSGDYPTYRIPALVVTAAGTVLAFCEGRRTHGHDDDEIDILLRRSHDGGRTWDRPRVVVADGDRTCGNPCPLVDTASGTVLLPFCKDNQQVFVTESVDDGQTWTSPREITDSAKAPDWSYLGTGPGHGIQLRDRRLLVPCWADESPGPVTWREPAANWGAVQSSYAIFSDDGGATWCRGGKMTHDASDECEAVEAGDGTLYMTLRSRQERLCRGFAFSDDGGNSWTPVDYEPALPEPSCQGSIVRYDENRVLMAHPSHIRARALLTVRLSDDGCRTWPRARVLYESASAYSDLAVTTGGEVLCLFEADDYTRLALARFPIAWVAESEA